MLYSVTANVTRKTPEGETTKGIPTFLLDDRIQGITGVVHAEQIAMGILNPFEDTSLNVSMVVQTVYPEN